MRIIIKGGVWKNTEDEILKAAVSKYGKNQWSRISSLLVRKTASQCKARWMEWLDPGIRKTEWSKEEDERLLHLAKLMPTQWRTIAPIVGRTASQCLERYQKLLDDAEQQAGLELGLTGAQGDSGPSADDVRRLRPGEIDPDPETKPARPDPVDMDEDEKEMLSEARARLANTQGKKAKRKARERQLEEARRLTALQKKRELKAAGIELKQKKKKKGMDYNADIPFEAKPAPGFYDTTEELKRESNKRLTNVRLEQLDGKRRADVEEEERKKDAKRQKMKKDNPDTQASQNQAQLRKLKEAELDSIARRKKMVLPAPHVGEAELQEILKIGSVADDAKALAEGSDIAATRGLMGTYKSAGTNLPTRTPRASASQDSVMVEALNQRAMLNQQTPLLGGETPLYKLESGTGYDGVTPRHNVAQTPNPYASVRGVGATPLRTPLRDELSINSAGGASVMATPREERLHQAALKRQLRAGLEGLPMPKGGMELLMPEELDIDTNERVVEEDAAEIAKRRKEAFEAEERARLLRRSQAVQRDLPRPTVVRINGESIVRMDNPLDEADRLIQEELTRLVTHDSVAYPPVGSKVAGSSQHASQLEDLSDDYLALAKSEVAEEMAGPEAKEKYDAFAEEFNQVWAQIQEEMQQLQQHQISLSAQFAAKRGVMTKQATKAGKLEKRLGITLGGLQARSQILSTQLLAAHEDLQGSELELESFQNLRIMEQSAVEMRMESMTKEVNHLVRRESELQQKWDGLNRERQDVMERVEKLLQKQQEKNQPETAKATEAAEVTAATENDDDEDIGPQPTTA
ncbi:Pre-mRNA-splicing factor cef1 [Podila minutissima]|uniref:Pre-mRNA-splicing factor cef1 n=1 Tax=Podila minutissima TaxID=64525 RepID=A0A9P5STP8_9FUNG|nr:Pre-mRNA-splicing factor cef1 [Podila minutissima]